MRYIHQFDGKGNHRLGFVAKQKGNLTKEEAPKWGKWAGYTAPAAFRRGKSCTIAVTDYYKDSAEFPDPNKLYKVNEEKTSVTVETA